jgi:Zn-dependent M28 family amino/carboxypeptidase
MTLLVLGEILAASEPLNQTVRFAFWAAEEPGLLGSTAYAEGLAPDERARIGTFLNFDMLGSVNRQWRKRHRKGEPSSRHTP